MFFSVNQHSTVTRLQEGAGGEAPPPGPAAVCLSIVA